MSFPSGLVAYLHGEQYILPILLLFAVVLIGPPVAAGALYFWWRNRDKK